MKSNYRFLTVNNLNEQIAADGEKVQFHGIFENGNGGVALLAFKAGQKLDTHLAPAEVMVLAMDGEIDFTTNGEAHRLRKGEFLLMGADVPHSVEAVTDAKVMLVKIKPD